LATEKQNLLKLAMQYCRKFGDMLFTKSIIIQITVSKMK